MRVGAKLAVTMLALCVAGGVRAADAAGADGSEPNALDLFELANAQAFGGDVVQVWKSSWDGRELVFGIARRWESGKLAVMVRVFSPHKYDPLAFLLRPREGSLPSIVYYRSAKLFPVDPKTGRTLDVQVASPIERLPFAPGLPALADLWPPRASDFSLHRLADAEVQGKPCRVLEARLRKSAGDYDRFVTSLARDSEVALDTTYFRGEKWVRRVTILPTDLDHTANPVVVRRRTVERPGEATQVLTLERFSQDPVFPDQLFTSSNLRTGRFPSY